MKSDLTTFSCSIQEESQVRAILSWLRGELTYKDAADSVGVTQTRLDRRIYKICMNMRLAGFETPPAELPFYKDKSGYAKVVEQYAKLCGYGM